MSQRVLCPRQLRFAPRRRAVFPARVVGEVLVPPVTVAEGRIAEHDIGLQLGELVVAKRIASLHLRRVRS